VEVGDDGDVTVAVPETTLHVPVPTEGAFPASVAVFVLHNVWSAPALAVVGNRSTVTVTSSVEGGQTPFEIVQRKTYVDPADKPVTAVVAEFGLEIVAVPETTLHTPVPTEGVLAESVADVAPHITWSLPAFAVVGTGLNVIIIVSVSEGHVPLFVVVRYNCTDPPDISAGVGLYVTLSESLSGENVPFPPDHVPVLTPVTVPFRLTEGDPAQNVWSVPALAVIVDAKAVTVTESVTGWQSVVSVTVT
jgi:hypothetical protein